jgi:acetate kinase
MKIVIVNAGSSSLKVSLYEVDQLPEQPALPQWQGQVDWNHQSGKSEFQVKTTTSSSYQVVQDTIDRFCDTKQLLLLLWTGQTAVLESPQEIDVVGQRVVHGGDIYYESVWIDEMVAANIDRLSKFAPLHNPANLAGITAVTELCHDVRQIAVFDTAFHRHLSPAASVYPLPHRYLTQGIKRYGFHGTSHQYCSHRAAQILGKDLAELRLISCHLGNGCSLAAIQGGQSIDTTMGFTPLEGLMMGSRSGSIDPGILIHLMRTESLGADDLERMLNSQSGLLGLSDVSADLRQVQMAVAVGNQQAQLAMDVYIHRLRSEMGAMLASLGGVDALIFTAGVGENSASIRAAASQGWDFLGMQLDQALNNRLDNAAALQAIGDTDIATPDSAVRILVIHTQEDWVMVQECWQLIHCND